MPRKITYKDLNALTIQSAFKRKQALRTANKPVPKAMQKKTASVPASTDLKLSKPMKQLVQSQINASKLDHFKRTIYLWNGLQGIPYHPTGGAPSGIYNIIPSIHQVGAALIGGGQQPDDISSREGNSISLKNIVCNLNLILSPSYNSETASNSGIRYKILILSCKKYSQYNDMVDNFFDTAGSLNMQKLMFKDGAQAVGWDENMQNFELPVNRDLFTVHAERNGKLNRGLNIGDSGEGYTTNQMATATLKIPLKVKSKKLKYETPKDYLSTNFAPFIWIGYKAYDGTVLHSGNYLHMVGNSVISWENN